ncbi:MAG: NAD-dependent epimerase/dehydratase family protein [Patescibacteria group bacterium]
MQYLVTGGAGFIGTNIVEALLTRGDSVRILDDFSTGKRERVPAAAELVEDTITNLETCRRACEGIDGVFHTAALARMPRSIEDPIGTNDANVNGTLNMLVAARDAGVKRFVFSGSSSVYGVQDTLPLKEDMKPRPGNPYALQKLAGEEYCRLFWELYHFPTVTLRYFNVYGGKYQTTDGAYALVFGIFIRQKRAGEPLTLCGDGEYRRDFTHVDDVVRANLLAMGSETVGHGEVINIGAGDNHTVKELAALLGGPTTFIPPRPGDARDSLADRALAKELLGWEPSVPFEDGVRGTLKELGLS